MYNIHKMYYFLPTIPNSLLHYLISILYTYILTHVACICITSEALRFVTLNSKNIFV